MLILQKLLEYIFDKLKLIISKIHKILKILLRILFIIQKFINEKNSKRFLLISFFLKI